jgi:hypothetical protein
MSLEINLYILHRGKDYPILYRVGRGVYLFLCISDQDSATGFWAHNINKKYI